jgi:DNA-binding MarR family transcriptional regulator
MKDPMEALDFENSLGPWMGKTIKMVEYHLQKAFDDAGLDLTKEQMIVLKKLHQKDGRNQIELAFVTLRNKSSLTRLLRKMERKNYIIRKQGVEDKRAKHVFITARGKEVFMACLPIIAKIKNRIEEGLSDTQKHQFILTLKQIQANFGEDVSHF